ncbi:unnamed protein product [Mytilus coruscus]|uniref:BPTI/Kunitz inhibitor domain-containing protein n=1 Tax=Mytilus coruscus TaxID=42192 RepID=A0A6J8BRW5_MYTCO|nr:unnamed protein product [Mytilus coruscus]
MKQLALLVCVLLYARSVDGQARKATPKPVATGAVGKMDRNCFDMPRSGMCMGMFVQRWFFSEATGRCFMNRGCFYQGFATIRECNKECRCKQPLNEGAGSGGFNCELEVQKYAFVGEACTPFMYTGCGGNGNRFNSVTRCMNTCKVREFEQMEMMGEFPMMGQGGFGFNQMGWNGGNMGNNGGGFRNGMNRRNLNGMAPNNMNSNGMGSPMNGMGNPSMGMGNAGMGMGISGMGMGNPSMGMGNSGVGNPSMGVTNQNMGMRGWGNGQMGMGNNGGNGMGNMGTTMSNMNNQNLGLANANSGMGSRNSGMGSRNSGMGSQNSGINQPNPQSGSFITGSTSGVTNNKASTGIANPGTVRSKNVRDHILDKSAMPNQGNGQMPGMTNPGTGWTNTGMGPMGNTNNPGIGNTGLNNNPTGSVGSGGGGMNMVQNIPPGENHNFGQGNSIFGSGRTQSQSSFGNNNAMNPTTTIMPGSTNMATWMYMGIK